MSLVRPEQDGSLTRGEQLRPPDAAADYTIMSAGWRTLGAVIGKSLLLGSGTAILSFLTALGVFVFIVPRLLDAPDLSAPTFALLVGHGGLFLGLLLGLLLQIGEILPLSPWQQALHVVVVIVVAVTAWGTTDIVVLEPATVGTLVETTFGDLS